jgi:hypothetical protein
MRRKIASGTCPAPGQPRGPIGSVPSYSVEATTAELITAWGTAALAVGTVGTLAVALRQLAAERRARRADEARAERRAHRWQAERVSAWYAGETGDESVLELENASEQPVYQVVVSLAFVQGAAPRTTEEWREVGEGGFPFTRCLVALPPGRHFVSVPTGWGAMAARPGAEVAFTDVQENSWVRRAGGSLEELPTNGIDALGIPRPVDFVPPRRSREGDVGISL